MKRHEDKSTGTADGEGVYRSRPLERWRWAHLFRAIRPRRRP